MIKMGEWKATECHTEDHHSASITMSINQATSTVDINVAGHAQTIGPDTALCMAAWLVAFALQAKGLKSDAISFVVKHNK